MIKTSSQNLSPETSTVPWYAPLTAAFKKMEEERQNKSFGQGLKETALSNYYFGKGALRWGLKTLEKGCPGFMMTRDLYEQIRDPKGYEKKQQARGEALLKKTKDLFRLGVDLIRHPIRTRRQLIENGFKATVQKTADFVALPQTKKLEAMGEATPEIALNLIGVGEIITASRLAGSTGMKIAADVAAAQVPQSLDEMLQYAVPKIQDAYTSAGGQKSLVETWIR